LLIIAFVMYRKPVTGRWSPRIVHRQSIWLADMLHAYWAVGSEPSRRQHGRKQSKWRRLSSDLLSGDRFSSVVGNISLVNG